MKTAKAVDQSALWWPVTSLHLPFEVKWKEIFFFGVFKKGCLCFCLAVSSSRAALDRAAVLLKMSLGGLRMDNQWGTGGGQRPITQLIKEVNLMIHLSYTP